MNNKELPQQANMPYPYPVAYQDNDEIDLIELFRTLWKQKAKIALVTAVTTLAAGIYAFTAEEVWTSKAVLDTPKLEEIGSYYEFTQQLRRTLQKPTIGAITLIPDQITKEVFTEFQKQTNSIDLRREFWSQSDYYHDLVKDIKSEKDKEKILKEVEDGIHLLFDNTCYRLEKINVEFYDEETLYIEFLGEDSALLIGKEGYRYKALSYILFNWINEKYGLHRAFL